MAPARAFVSGDCGQGERIVALAAARHGLDNLIGAGTRILDDPSITLLPAFIDTQSAAGSHSQSYICPGSERSFNQRAPRTHSQPCH